MRRTTTEPRQTLQQISAVAVVVCLHGLLLHAIRQTPAPPSTSVDTLQVVFVPERQVQPPPIPAVPPPVRGPSRHSSPQAKRGASAVSEPTTQIPPGATLLVIDGDDRWAPMPGPSNGATFVRSPMQSPPNPLGPLHPERFKMRVQRSPRDVVRGIAKFLGFWPPGYTDDPCGGLERSVELLSRSNDEASRKQLFDALVARERYCG